MGMLGIVTCEILKLEFSRLLGLGVQEREGTLDMLSQAWNAAKAFLERNGS